MVHRQIDASAATQAGYRVRSMTRWLGACIFAILITGCGESKKGAGSNEELEAAMNAMKATHLYSVIFRYYPEAENEIRKKLGESIVAAASMPPDEAASSAQQLVAELTDKYLDSALPKASSATLFELFKNQAEILTMLRQHPELCVNHALGKPYYGAPEMTPEVLGKEANTKANVIESSFINPEPLLAPPDMKEVSTRLLVGYSVLKYPVENFEELAKLNELPADKGCEISTQFAKVLVQLGPRIGPLTYKQITYTPSNP